MTIGRKLAVDTPEPPAGTEIATTSRRVALRDVDAAGILYVAVPYAWQEELWTGLLHERGYPLGKQLAAGVTGPVVASWASYRAPIRLDSVLTCRLYTEHVGNTSFGLRMDASTSAGPVALSVGTRQVWCTIGDGLLEPAPLPAWLRALLSEETDGQLPAAYGVERNP